MKPANKPKIYILGLDKAGWSINSDHLHTKMGLEDSGCTVTRNILAADVIFSVWWNALLTKKMKIFRTVFKNKKIIATITNDLSHQEKELDQLMQIADIYVYSNSTQKNILLNRGIQQEKLVFNPFYVDERIFKDLSMDRQGIAQRLGIDFESIKGKCLIGSFQRDSLGADLTKQKWQKNPDGLIDILGQLDRSDFMLILAGPRRHYIVNRCKQESIPYLFIGNQEPLYNSIDDISINILDKHKMSLLYNLIDLYIVSSLSEGGPKAIPEAVLTRTAIISSDVGFAKDLLYGESIYTDTNDAVNKIDLLMKNAEYRKRLIKENLQKVGRYYNFDLYKARLRHIIELAISS